MPADGLPRRASSAPDVTAYFAAPGQRPGPAGVSYAYADIQDADGTLRRGRRHAQRAASRQIVEERLQRLVEKLVGCLSWLDITDPAPISRPTVELVDIQTPQDGLDLLRDRAPVAGRHARRGQGFDAIP